MEEAVIPGSRQRVRGFRLANVGLAILIVAAFMLALLISLLAQVLLASPTGGLALVVLAVLATPLLTLLVAIAISLKPHSRQVRWAVAALFLVGVPLIIFSGALSWLLNTM